RGSDGNRAHLIGRMELGRQLSWSMIRRKKFLRAFSVCLVVFFTPLANIAGSGGIPLATEDRLQLPGWWPNKGTASRDEFVGPDVCASCHASRAQTQKRTPMAMAAARPADSEALRSHNQLTFRVPPYTYQIIRTKDGSTYSVTDGARTISPQLSWAFGLGESGQTYILERNGTFFESRVSYFRTLDGLDFTP